MHTEEVVCQTIFLDEFLERFAGLLPVAALLLRGQEKLCHRHEDKYSDSQCHKTYRKEGKERDILDGSRYKPVCFGIDQSLLNDHVRRSTDKGHHTAHAAGKGQRHKKTARRGTRICSHTHNDRKHQSHRTCVAYESSYECSHKHHKKEEARLACSCKLDYLTSDHLRETCLEDTASYDEKAYHHDDCGIGKSCKRLCRRQDLAQKKGKKGTKCHEVGPDLAADEQCRRYYEYD